MSYTFGFIGVGNMGGALARAACRWNPRQVVLTNRSMEKAISLAEELDCDVAMDNATVAREAKFIFLGVKPAGMGQVLMELAPVLAQRTDRFVLVSMAAGLQLDRLAQMLGRPAPMLRIMPNTPVAIGQGMILYTAGPGVDREDLEEFLIKMDAAGRFDSIDEKLMDAGSSVSGCGPAQGKGSGICGSDAGGRGPDGAGDRQASRSAEGRGVQPRRQHHCRRSRTGGGPPAGRGYQRGGSQL